MCACVTHLVGGADSRGGVSQGQVKIINKQLQPLPMLGPIRVPCNVPLEHILYDVVVGHVTRVSTPLEHILYDVVVGNDLLWVLRSLACTPT